MDNEENPLTIMRTLAMDGRVWEKKRRRIFFLVFCFLGREYDGFFFMFICRKNI